MKNTTPENTNVTRRSALKVVGAALVVPGTLSVVACSETEKPAAKAPPPPKPKTKAAASKPSSEPSGATASAGGELNCAEGATIDAQSKQMRTTLKYVEKSAEEGKKCSNCLQWVAPEGDSKCGGCKLFTGPVNPNGHCLSWAKQQG